MSNLRKTIYRKWTFFKFCVSWWWFARQWTRKSRRVKRIMDQRADAYAELKAEVERLRAKLQRVRGILKFFANSEGGIVAEIDEVLITHTQREEETTEKKEGE